MESGYLYVVDILKIVIAVLVGNYKCGKYDGGGLYCQSLYFADSRKQSAVSGRCKHLVELPNTCGQLNVDCGGSFVNELGCTQKKFDGT